MAKVYLDPGHGGNDPGAVKYVTEKHANLTMALACRDYLVANGVTVKMSRTTDTGISINTVANDANKWGADLVISIHNNAGGGDGFEVFHSINGGKGKTLASNIEAEVKKIGQNSRGLKTKKNSSGSDYFGVIRLTNAPAVICEGAFVDNKSDAAQIDTTAEQQAFGYAYARGILKTLGIADKGLNGGKEEKKEETKPVATTTTTTASKGYLVKVSKATVNIMKDPPVIVRKCPVGTYTIVDEKNGYGKLKSGEGWIKLAEVTKK